MISPEALRPHYARFLAAQPGASGPRARVLLTGHSHQAWPDVARAAQLEAYDDAAAHVDEKWGPAFAKADALRATIAARIGAEAPEIALAASTHELVARFLSALDLRARPRLVTTSGEFHSMHRQLTRLAAPAKPFRARATGGRAGRFPLRRSRISRLFAQARPPAAQATARPASVGTLRLRRIATGFSRSSAFRSTFGKAPPAPTTP